MNEKETGAERSYTYSRIHWIPDPGRRGSRPTRTSALSQWNLNYSFITACQPVSPFYIKSLSSISPSALEISRSGLVNIRSPRSIMTPPPLRCVGQVGFLQILQILRFGSFNAMAIVGAASQSAPTPTDRTRLCRTPTPNPLVITGLVLTIVIICIVRSLVQVRGRVL